MTTSRSDSRALNGVDLDAMQQTIAAIRAQPELGAATFRSHSRWRDDRRVSTTVDTFDAGGARHDRSTPHLLHTDLPQALLGTDLGPSPLELALSALGSCVTTTLVAHATAKQVKLNSLSVLASGDLDLRGFLNLAEVRSGYQGLELKVELDAELEDDQVASFVESALRFSPVLDLFRRGTSVMAIPSCSATASE